jgi:single-strand DNA-binding protein
MLNRIIIMGRLVRDPELRSTPNGVPVTSFTLAVDRDRKDESGNRVTDFIDVTVWKQTAEFVCKYFGKGRMAVVEGRLQIREYKDKEGNNRRAAEIVAHSVYFADSKNSNDGQSHAGGYEAGTVSAYGSAPDFAAMDDNYGELPF